MKKILISLLISFASITSFAQITGAGATFPAPLYFKWAELYEKETGKKINYQSIGSSGGLRQIDNRTVNFGASDEPRTQEELDEKKQIQFPMVTGGVVVVVNIPGVENNSINLTNENLANIFAGRVTNWKEINSKLPDLAITLVHRADGSGTTFVFTDYLSKVSFFFKSEIGVGKSVKWKGLTIGGKGNAGVAALVKQTKGSIGYVEYAYAKQNNLITTKIDGKTANLETFKTKSWPLTADTYIILYPTADAKSIIDFFEWCYKNDKVAIELDYVPLSDSIKNSSRSLWKKNNLN